MRVAIVIPTPDANGEMAGRCLESVEKTTAGSGVELHVVESSGPEFRFSRSVNRGLRASPGADAWVLLNDDAWMDPGWLEAMVETADLHAHVGLVGAVLRFPDGRIQHAGGYLPLSPAEFLAAGIRHGAALWAIRRIAKHRFRDDTYMSAHWHEVSPRHRLDFLSAACVLVTRRCREAIGDYTEEYRFGFEDVDHSLRTLAAGFELALATRATGVHHETPEPRRVTELLRASEATFRARWTVDQVRALTRRSGRIGCYT